MLFHNMLNVAHVVSLRGTVALPLEKTRGKITPSGTVCDTPIRMAVVHLKSWTPYTFLCTAVALYPVGPVCLKDLLLGPLYEPVELIEPRLRHFGH